MKRSVGLWVVLVAAALGLSGCQTKDEARLEDSESAWRALVRQQGAATYSYVVPQSSWTGFSTRTALQLESGSVTYRRYESTTWVDDNTLSPIALQWEERGAELGNHTGAAPLATLDDQYRRCATEVLTRDPDDNGIYLEFDARNILQTCVYVPKGCVDDCSFGVTLADVELGIKY